MSKRLDIEVNCPHCGQKYKATVFRTIWGEYEENRNMVINDNINIVSCPQCHFSFHAPLAMMYVDVKKNFAVWWEPYYDSSIDSDSAGYSKIFGERSYYATAPRISDWEEFKDTINKYYKGELVGGPIEKMDFQSLGKSKAKNNGCLGIMFLLILCASLVALI